MRKIKAQPGFYFVLALSVLMIPFQWCVAWLVASLVHELSHIVMLKLLRCRILSITLGTGGAVIEANCETPVQKLLCTVAGPIGGALLLLYSGLVPRVAVCAMLQSVYNLLPFSELDGGRALECVVYAVFSPKTAERILWTVRYLAVAILALLALYGGVYLHLGLMPGLMVGILLVKNKKSLAKKDVTKYNDKDKHIRGYGYGRKNHANFAHCSKTGTIYRRGIQ